MSTCWAGSGCEVAVGVAVVLDEDEVPDFHDARVVAVDVAGRRFCRGCGRCRFRCTGRRGRCRPFPRSCPCRSSGCDRRAGPATFFQMSAASVSRGTPFFSSPSKQRDVQAVGSSFQTLVRSSHAISMALLLEVVAEGPVAEHFEEGVVAASSGRRRRGRCACRRRGCTSGCWRRGCQGRVCPWPRKIGLNWFMPALVNSSVGSSSGTTGDEARTCGRASGDEEVDELLADLRLRSYSP